MSQITELTPSSQLITQYNRALLLGPLVGATKQPHIVVTAATDTVDFAQAYGDIWSLIYRFSARINQTAVIFVATALLASLIQQHGPKSLIWIRKNMSKFLYRVAYLVQIKELSKIKSAAIDVAIT